MSDSGDRWEVGSLFHLARFAPGQDRGRCPWQEHNGILLGSGRDALRLLLTSAACRRVWVPSYFCQEVVAAIASCPVTALVYPDSPLDSTRDLSALPVEAGDGILVMNYFGLRTSQALRLPERADITIIEDHTHDPCSPWALGSTADYCVASLRKLYPVPDGGVLWSPRGHSLPAPPALAPELCRASLDKLAGMILKGYYLDGHPVPKERFRGLLARGETALYGARISTITELSRDLLTAFPLAAWRAQRLAHFRRICDRFPAIAGVRLLKPTDPEQPPFVALVVFDDPASRDRVHRQLIDQRIYASALWPLDNPVLAGIPTEHRALAGRLFTIPLDMRYNPTDIDLVAEILAQTLQKTLDP
ncbi:MAG: hypothetical protein AAGC55_10555 [Myxococcota bacterium]